MAGFPLLFAAGTVVLARPAAEDAAGVAFAPVPAVGAVAAAIARIRSLVEVVGALRSEP